MLLPILGVILASALLLKLGALSVWVSVMTLILKLAVVLIFILAGMLTWKTFKK